MSNSPRANADSIVANLRHTFDEPYQLVLELGDSLLLQRAQVETIAQVLRALTQRNDFAWRRLGEKFADRQQPLGGSAAGVELERTYGVAIKPLQSGVSPLRTILVPAQLKLVPANVTRLLNRKGPLYDRGSTQRPRSQG